MLQGSCRMACQIAATHASRHAHADAHACVCMHVQDGVTRSVLTLRTACACIRGDGDGGAAPSLQPRESRTPDGPASLAESLSHWSGCRMECRLTFEGSFDFCAPFSALLWPLHSICLLWSLEFPSLPFPSGKTYSSFKARCRCDLFQEANSALP